MKLLSKLLTLCCLLFCTIASAQTDKEELITLGKVYRAYHFSNTPSEAIFKELNEVQSPDLQYAKVFLAELIKTNNQIATKRFLIKPDSASLYNLFIVRSINWNMAEANPIDNHRLIDSLKVSQIHPLELLSAYYGMVFTAVANKNRPLQMADVNFDLNAYRLENDSEKGVFFLRSMETFGMFIWGYMNVVKPPNFKKALKEIAQYPTYNGEPYYQYQYLNFPDFVLTLDKRKPKESFKQFFINRYLNTLFYHTACLAQKKRYREEKEKVLLGSILRNESYYQYSATPELFQKLFSKADY